MPWVNMRMPVIAGSFELSVIPIPFTTRAFEFIEHRVPHGATLTQRAPDSHPVLIQARVKNRIGIETH